MNTKVRFSGGLSLSELIRIAKMADYHKMSIHGGVVTHSHQGHKFMPDGTYIAVHAFRMREQTEEGVETFNKGLIEVRIEEDPDARKGHLAIYVTINY